MSNTITGLDSDVIAAAALEGFVAGLIPLRAVSVDYSQEAGARGASVTVPLVAAGSVTDATDFEADDSTWGSTQVTLNAGKKIAWGLTDSEFSRNIAAVEQKARVNGQKLAQYVLTDVLSLVTNANFGAGTAVGASSGFLVNDLPALTLAATQATMPKVGRSLVIGEAYSTNLMTDANITDAAAYGTAEGIREGKVARLMGMDVYGTDLVSSSDNTVGHISVPSAIAFAGRYLAPQKPEAYLDARPLVDEETGIVLGFRRFYDVRNGTDTIAITAMWGKAVGIAAHLLRLKSA